MSPLFTMLLPLFFLAIGAIAAGFVFKEIFIGHQYQDFWQSSILFLSEINHGPIPIWFLLLTPILVIFSIPISFYYFTINTKKF